jgi:aryl-alcohol dehydrogenase-like predicted oxidoreductase
MTMEMRALGRSGLRLSILGFGCGAVGGLMVRGDPADQERAIARALDVGVNYFDTAVQYGDGESEKNLGRVLAKLNRPTSSWAPRCGSSPPISPASAMPSVLPT